MTVVKKKVQQPTAREMLQPSVLRETQLELMGEDVDLSKLYLALSKGTAFNIIDAVTDVNIHRTIDGASTVEVTVEDRDRLLLNSGRLSARNDIEIDGLYFRLVSVRKDGPELTLTFEDREVTLMRRYATPIKQSLKTSRARGTRAEFVLRMIKEVKETPIRYVIPELHKQQPIDGASKLPPTLFNQKNKGGGIPKGTTVIVEGHSRMTEEQRVNANIIIQTGIAAGAAPNTPTERKVLVMAIMCVIQESRIKNLPQPQPGDYNYLSSDPNRNPVGCFQQIKHWGWPATRDVATDAAEFFKRIRLYVSSNPKAAYQDAIEHVQNSGDASAYAKWRTNADRIVTAFGMTEGAAADANAQWSANTTSSTYEFYRGLPPSSKIRKQKFGGKWGPENSWDCIQRLAQEVQWRAFFVSGVFYFMSEDELFKTQPIAILDEETEGIDSIDGEYDEGKKGATLEVSCRMGRWDAPPGSVVGIENMGPWGGRWLVSDVERSAFSDLGRITLKKPLPRLPEPSGSNLISGTPDKNTWHLAPPPGKTIDPANISAKEAAQKLIDYSPKWYRGDNPYQLPQLRKIADGQKLHSQCGDDIWMNARVLGMLVMLIEKGFMIGTFAFCEDHHCNNGQHPKGQAVDISSVGTLKTGWGVVGDGKQTTTNVMKEIMHILGPSSWDLICNGNGSDMADVQQLQYDNNLPRGGVWETDHRDHIHFGIAPGPRD